MLKQIRKKMGLSQLDLAVALGVCTKTVGNWERSNNAPLYVLYAYKGLAMERAVQ